MSEKEHKELEEVWKAWKSLWEEVLKDLRLDKKKLNYILAFKDIIEKNFWKIKKEIDGVEMDKECIFRGPPEVYDKYQMPTCSNKEFTESCGKCGFDADKVHNCGYSIRCRVGDKKMKECEKDEKCLLNTPHGQSQRLITNLIIKCQCPKHFNKKK